MIRRCGQAGIAGHHGATRSLITGNLIEETNYRREFGGWETAAIKFHNSVDTVISNNFIRGVFRQEQGAFGIWMDFGNQGTRITGNIICDTEAEAIFLEMDHGPMLIDNNVLLGGGVRANSENMVFAHNLFVDCPYRDQPDLERQSQFYTPPAWRSSSQVRRMSDARRNSATDWSLFRSTAPVSQMPASQPMSFAARHSITSG